jgi:hypothetical protein
MALIDFLIDKIDNCERVCETVGAILLVESLKQQEIAQVTPGKNPDDWKLRVFVERSSAFEEYLQPKDEGGQPSDLSPIVNVWFDNDTTDLHRSNLIETQTMTGVFNIDCYGCGIARESADGHEPADVTAAAEAKRAARWVRNILMSAQYYDLGLLGVVSRRWIQSRQMMQPPQDAEAVQRVIGTRLALHVDYIEQSPQVTGPLLEEISVAVRRRSDGLLYTTATFQPTE